MRRLLLLTATALSTAIPAFAQAPTPDLPDTIVTGTRVPTPADRVPAATTVITRQQIEERGYQTLVEALRSVPGFTIVQTGGIGQQASGFMRGANSNQVAVLLDGIPINDPSTASGAFNFGNTLLGDLERIEVIRGPASALYGSSAIGGAINMVTRQAPADRQFQAFGEAAGGTQDTARGVIGATGTVGAWDYMTALQGLTTRGSNAVAPRLSQNRTSERDGFQGAAATARLGVTPTQGVRLEGLLRWRENHLKLDSVPNDDPNYDGNDRNFYGQLRGQAVMFDGVWTSGLRLAQVEDRRRYTNMVDNFSRSSTDDLFSGTRQVIDWNNIIRLPDLGAITASSLVLGITQQNDSIDQSSGSASFRTLTDASATNNAAYSAWQFRVAERLDVAAGLRQDRTSDFDEATTWRLGGVLAVPELSSRIKASAGSGFLAPSLYQRYGTIGTSFRGNPNLRPEYSESWEAGVETDFNIFGRADGLTLGALYYDSRIRDLIDFNTSFTSLVNVGAARIKGAELTATARISEKWELVGAWTITDARNAATDERLARRPENQWSLIARWQPAPKWVISPELTIIGRYREGFSYSNTGQFVSVAADNDAGALLNLTASYAWRPQVTVFATAQNLGNTRYEPANGFVVGGRGAMIGTRFTF
ncbi:TonB-dependent receptor plug domain-containing protein [Humitalea sp. 24SJ18S-53]|uniref:TonB-dependent receptor plug domain-containing protein n=1 Tax=Humitalea sp. 24SJ18S-53 TaxID=3422307 RepID=UPI003D675ED9